MEKEILIEYEKVKNILSEEEFLKEMDEIGENDLDVEFINDIDLARMVVNNHIGDENITVDNEPNNKIEMTSELQEKYNQIKNFISEDEFLEKMNNLNKKYSDVSFMSVESFADQIVGEYITQENESLTEKQEYTTDKINTLEDGDKDKSIIGRVMGISNPRSFKTRSGNPGKVCNVTLADNTGEIRIALWTENIKHLKNISEGDIVNVSDVDIKDGYSGLEATMRPRSKFEKVTDANPIDFPEYEENITSISDIKADDTEVNVIARITKIPAIRTYNKNGKEGKVGSLELQDATGTISYTLWNNNVDLIESLELHDGDTVKILQAQVRERNGEISLSHWDGRLIKGEYDVPEFHHKLSKIGDLDDGDTDIAIMGVVSKIQDIRKFIRKSDNTEGQLRNFELMDDTGSMRITLWGDNADLNINKRDIVKLIGVNVKYDEYTTNGHSINTNFNTQITINPDNLSEDELELFNNIKDSLHPISLEQVKSTDEDDVDVDVLGRLMSVGDIRTFERASDGSTGRVRSAILSDGTEIVELSLWDEKTELDLKPSEAYQIENARIRWGYDDVNLNIGSSSRIIKLSEEDSKFLPSFETLESMIYEYREISDLDEDDTNIFIVGRVFEVFDMREIERDDGTKNLLRNIEVADNSQGIRVSLWGDDAKREFEPGEAIKIQNPSFSFYNDQLTLNISGNTVIVKPSEDELLNLPSYDELKEAIYVKKDIEAIEDGDVNVRVSGTLSEINGNNLLIRKCPQCNYRIGDVFEDEIICDNCGHVFDNPKTTIALHALLNDDTGSISISFFENLVEELLEMPKDEIVNYLSEDPGILDGRIEDLEGLTIEVIANVSFDEYREGRKLNPKKILEKYY